MYSVKTSEDKTKKSKQRKVWDKSFFQEKEKGTFHQRSQNIATCFR